MKQLFGKAVTARRFRLSLLAAGLFSLSVYTYAASVTVGGPTLPKVPFSPTSTPAR